MVSADAIWGAAKIITKNNERARTRLRDRILPNSLNYSSKHPRKSGKRLLLSEIFVNRKSAGTSLGPADEMGTKNERRRLRPTHATTCRAREAEQAGGEQRHGRRLGNRSTTVIANFIRESSDGPTTTVPDCMVSLHNNLVIVGEEIERQWGTLVAEEADIERHVRRSRTSREGILRIDIGVNPPTCEASHRRWLETRSAKREQLHLVERPNAGLLECLRPGTDVEWVANGRDRVG